MIQLERRTAFDLPLWNSWEVMTFKGKHPGDDAHRLAVAMPIWGRDVSCQGRGVE